VCALKKGKIDVFFLHARCLFGRLARAMTTNVIFKLKIEYYHQDLIRGKFSNSNNYGPLTAREV
jgi:hypothetical protein